MVVIIHQRQLFDLIITKDLFCLVQSGADKARHKVLLRHDETNRFGHIFFKFQIAVCDDTNKTVIIENLNNLDKLPQGLFTFCALPLRYENADGSPIRAVAILED